MGIEIDKYNGKNVPQELVDIYRLRSEISEGVRKTNEEKTEKAKSEANPEAHLDTYKKNVVSNSIEQQIKEQEAKIKEINDNLNVLREEYYDTRDKEDAARAERSIKARELYQKEISESSLKRMFTNWRKKYLNNKTDKSIEKEYNLSNLDYDTAMEERILADKDYDISDTEAYAAINAHNHADAQFLGGLWSKQDAYWDLAKMQQRLAVAKFMESRNNW